jgi:hypothetical protein
MPISPQELIFELLRRERPGSDYGGSSRMPMYDPQLLVPRGSIPQGEGESPPLHGTPDELEMYGDMTPGGGSPYSRPLPGENVDIGPGPGSELENIEETRRDRQQELIDKLIQQQAEEYPGY